MPHAAQLELERAAVQWQWAFDAADRALAADRTVLGADVLRAEAHALGEERRTTAQLLDHIAALYPREQRPWLCPLPVTPRLLGLPDGTEACVFDLDGVLADSDALHAAAWAEALDPVLEAASRPDRRFARFERDGDYRAYFDGRSRFEGIRLFLDGRGLRLPDAAVDAIATRKGDLVEHGLSTRGVAALPGAARYLRAAGLARIGRAVLSSSTTAVSMLEHAALARLVDTVIDARTLADAGLRSRPAPDALLHACELLGTAPARTASITHSGAGVVAAAGAGMPVVAIAGPGDAELMRAYGASVVMPSLTAMLDERLRDR